MCDDEEYIQSHITKLRKRQDKLSSKAQEIRHDIITKKERLDKYITWQTAKLNGYTAEKKTN